jgi:hypothetical protein
MPTLFIVKSAPLTKGMLEFQSAWNLIGAMDPDDEAWIFQSCFSNDEQGSAWLTLLNSWLCNAISVRHAGQRWLNQTKIRKSITVLQASYTNRGTNRNLCQAIMDHLMSQIGILVDYPGVVNSDDFSAVTEMITAAGVHSVRFDSFVVVHDWTPEIVPITTPRMAFLPFDNREPTTRSEEG